jgi:hypothetical protein
MRIPSLSPLVSGEGFLYVREMHDDIPMGMGEQLYSVDGSGGLIVGSLYIDNLGFELDGEV